MRDLLAGSIAGVLILAAIAVGSLQPQAWGWCVIVICVAAAGFIGYLTLTGDDL